MSLDTAIFHQDSFGYVCKELYGSWSYGFGLEEDKGIMDILDSSNIEYNLAGNWESTTSSSVKECWDPNSSSPEDNCTGSGGDQVMDAPRPVAPAAAAKRKRRRTRTCKNNEELESQRMTHIAVERNRRKQMNDYLAVIRSLMPSSYVQRGDQASIIGGAINFVKELEQHLQTLEVKKNQHHHEDDDESSSVPPPLFGDFFTFPQYSSTYSTTLPTTTTTSDNSAAENHFRPAALADIEVTMAESHANLKILSKKRPRQLLKLIAGLQCLWLTILHLNVTTTVDQMVLYSISVKIEEGCQLTTVDEIADAVNHLLGRIQEEAASSC